MSMTGGQNANASGNSWFLDGNELCIGKD